MYGVLSGGVGTGATGRFASCHRYESGLFKAFVPYFSRNWRVTQVAQVKTEKLQSPQLRGRGRAGCEKTISSLSRNVSRVDFTTLLKTSLPSRHNLNLPATAFTLYLRHLRHLWQSLL